VTNIGSGFANGSWHDEWILSTNGLVSGAVAVFEDSPCNNVPCGRNVNTNGSYTDSVNFTLPSLSSGTYYLIGITDDRTNELFESTYANNTSAPLAITVGTTDLAATNFSVESPAIAGMNLSVSFSVVNVSTNSYSSYWYDGVTLSTNATLAGAITNWDWNDYHSTTPGGSFVENHVIQLPGIAAGANYYLIAQADDRNFVPETSKANNLQVMQVTITNLPPSISLVAPTNATQLTSCIPVSFMLSAGVQLNSYPVTNVQFYDGTNLIGNTANPPYAMQSPRLDHGDHPITAQAIDKFGLSATSQVATVSVLWPSQLHVLRADLQSNDCVICMAALNGSNYVVQTTTNLQSPVVWQPLVTNLVNGSVLVVTNLRNTTDRFYRAKLLP